MLRPPPTSTLFPYTTLFRSNRSVSSEKNAARIRLGDRRRRFSGSRIESLGQQPARCGVFGSHEDRKSTRLNSSHVAISYAVFCLKKKKEKSPLDIRMNTLTD